MAEILIKGMEMPEGCYYCPILIGKANCICAITGTQIRIEKVREELEDERMPDCPLKELPPHGDLIDRSKLVLHGRVDDFGDLQEMNDYYDATEVMNAPTVLEASEVKV